MVAGSQGPPFPPRKQSCMGASLFFGKRDKRPRLTADGTRELGHQEGVWPRELQGYCHVPAGHCPAHLGQTSGVWCALERLLESAAEFQVGKGRTSPCHFLGPFLFDEGPEMRTTAGISAAVENLLSKQNAEPAERNAGVFSDRRCESARKVPSLVGHLFSLTKLNRNQ